MTADPRAPGAAAMWDIAVATRVATEAAAGMGPDCDPALTEAVLADLYRDARALPLPHGPFRELTARLDPCGWQRLAVIAGMVGSEPLRAALPAVCRKMSVAEQVEAGMVAPACALHDVSLRMLSASAVRAEELARRVAAGLGIGIQGETAAQSDTRRAQIDYPRLLQSAAAARTCVEEWLQVRQRLEHLDEADLATWLEAALGHRAPRQPATGPLQEGPALTDARGAWGRLAGDARAWAQKTVAELLRSQEAHDRRAGRRGSG